VAAIRPATVDLTPLFAPRGVAVLGASRNPGKLGHRLVQNLLASGFAGDVFPVNPSGESIVGKDAVTSAEDIPRGLDLALVSLQTGRAGRDVQEEIGAIARATGMRIVGPNCMGVVNVPGRLNASYFWDVPWQPGVISFVSQSGAYGGLFFREVRERSLGVAKFLSIGNQSDLGFTKCLAWLADDPDTRVVGLFVEGIRDGRASSRRPGGWRARSRSSP
jgi:acyl-CoA synthetase (NDP forming)